MLPLPWAAQAQFFKGSNKLENETISSSPSHSSKLGSKSFFPKLISQRHSIGGLRITVIPS